MEAWYEVADPIASEGVHLRFNARSEGQGTRWPTLQCQVWRFRPVRKHPRD